VQVDGLCLLQRCYQGLLLHLHLHLVPLSACQQQLEPLVPPDEHLPPQLTPSSGLQPLLHRLAHLHLLHWLPPQCLLL
jgi:hypothetical protein